jgi:hypothetical protein
MQGSDQIDGRVAIANHPYRWLGSRGITAKDPADDRAADGGALDDRGEMDHGRSQFGFSRKLHTLAPVPSADNNLNLILLGHQIDLVILRPHDKLPAPLESACRWLSFFPLIKSFPK